MKIPGRKSLLWAAASFVLFLGGCQDVGIMIDPVADIEGTAVELSLTDKGKIEHHEVSFQRALEVAGDKTIVVDFWVHGCGPCRMLAPELEEVANRYPDDIMVLKVNAGEESQLARHFEVGPVPDLRYFRHGNATGSLMSFRTADQVAKKAGLPR